CRRALPWRACATSGVRPRKTASEEACVESALTQRGGNGAADVESVRAVHDNWCVGRELASPLVNALWIGDRDQSARLGRQVRLLGVCAADDERESRQRGVLFRQVVLGI